MFRHPMLRRVAALTLSMAIVYQPSVFAGQLALPSGDLVAPVVEHNPTTVPIRQGAGYKISVKVTDNVGVKNVILFYRTVGNPNYSRILMTKGQGDMYATQLSDETIAAPGLEYYIQAEDLAGNTLLHGYSFSPLMVKVTQTGGLVAANEGLAATGIANNTAETPIWKNKWVWIGLGIVAIAAASSGGGGGGGEPGGAPDTSATVNVTAPAP